MILVLSGTRDGRDIVERLSLSGCKVIASVVSDYGAGLLSDSNAMVLKGNLTEESFDSLLAKGDIKAIVDATHPYAEKISLLAIELASKYNVGYFRYQRPGSTLPENPLVFRVADYSKAAEVSLKMGDTVFLTTGSKTLHLFAGRAKEKGKRVIARVLPDEKVISHCMSCGLSPADIIAMQGPFSKKINQAMLEQTGASVLVTKDSGQIGGTEAKIEAALEMNIPVVVIERPLLKGSVYESIAQLEIAVTNFLKS